MTEITQTTDQPQAPWRVLWERKYSLLAAVGTLLAGVAVASAFDWGDSAVFWGVLGAGIGASLMGVVAGPVEAPRYPADAPVRAGNWHVAWVTDSHPRRAVATTLASEAHEVSVALHGRGRDPLLRRVSVDGERATLTGRPGDAHVLVTEGGERLLEVAYSRDDAGERLTVTAEAVRFEVPLAACDDPVKRLVRSQAALSEQDVDPQLGTFAMAYVAADQYLSRRRFRQRFAETLHEMP